MQIEMRWSDFSVRVLENRQGLSLVFSGATMSDQVDHVFVLHKDQAGELLRQIALAAADLGIQTVSQTKSPTRQ